MRRAVEAAGPVDLNFCSDEDLRCVVETDKNEQRRRSADGPNENTPLGGN